MTGKPGAAADRRAAVARWFPQLVARIRASIHSKLLFGFLVIVALMMALGVVALSSLNDADARAAELLRLERRIAAYRQLQHNATGQLYATASALLASDARDVAAARRQLERLAYDFERAEFISDTDARLLRQIAGDYSEFIRAANDVIDLVADGQLEEARSLNQNLLVPLAGRLERNAYALVNLAESGMIDEVDASARAFRFSQTAVIAVALGSILLALTLGYALSSSLITPIQAIRHRLQEIARGDLDHQVIVENRDELGDLSKNVNKMSAELNQLYLELEDANRHKSTFLANMSHELRTPMNAIIGFNRLVMRRCEAMLPKKDYENLGKISIAADQLLTLINSILDLSKIEAGRMDVNPTETPLAATLTSCIRTIEPLVQAKAVKLVCELPDDLPIVFTDHDRLRQVILNFLSNAAKFTDKGEIKLTCLIKGENVHISVSDTGIGIPEDQLTTIFEEFSQVDSSNSRKYSGTGLGLAISSRLAQLLGGGLAVESVVNEGSTFTVWFPLRIELAPDAKAPVASAQREIEGAAS